MITAKPRQSITRSGDVTQSALPKIERLTKMFRYLDALRDSGVTNMFGAPPYLEEAFNIPKRGTAITIVAAWMKSFEGLDRDSDPRIRAEAALNNEQMLRDYNKAIVNMRAELKARKGET